MAQFLGMSDLGMFLTLSAAVSVAELVGYLLHRMLHSGHFPSLSRGHMIHHLLLYGPNQSMRATAYKVATIGGASIGNVGWEWLLPSGSVLLLCRVLMWFFHVPWRYQVLALATMLAWPIFMFSYLHDRMHLRNFWMERTPLLRIWFRRARHLHDIHHRVFNDDGRMDRNFGIGFFFFDRLFRTFAKKHCLFNQHGYRAALERYELDHTADDEFSRFPSGFRGLRARSDESGSARPGYHQGQIIRLVTGAEFLHPSGCKQRAQRAQDSDPGWSR